MSLFRKIAPDVTRSPLAATEWEPFRRMGNILRWDPFREISEYFVPSEALPMFSPDFEVRENIDSYIVAADLPGVLDKDLEINLVGNRLIVGGKREAEKETKGETRYTCERSYGSFSRSFTLPEGIDVDHVTAAMKDGVLTIVLPKKPEVQPKKIALKTTENPS